MDDIASAGFWEAVVDAASGDRLRAKSEHLESCAIALEIDGHCQTIEFHKGNVFLHETPDPRGARFVIRGPRKEWERLMTGSIHYMRAINGLHGHLRIEGDFLAATWAGPAICELMRVAVKIRNEANDYG